LILASFLVESLHLDANYLDSNSQTLLFYAARDGCVPLATYLLTDGHSDVNHRDQLMGQSPLFYAARSGQFELIRLLANHGADLDLLDFREETAIYYAITNGRLRALEVIVELGASLNLKAKSGESPLSLAEKKIQRRMVSVIKNALENLYEYEGKPAKKEVPKGKPGRKPSK
jgi:uncharacterized protein